MDEAELDRLAGRLRSAALRDCLRRWCAARGGSAVPRHEAWDDCTPGAAAQVAVDLGEDGRAVRVRVVRSAPKSSLLQVLLTRTEAEAAGWVGPEELGRPAQDRLDVAFGPQGAQVIERLRLPFASGGGRVDRLIYLLDAGGPPRDGDGS